ncbi:hypothetical protein QBC42DRAFT_270851 [Cladorrhinum samala]|uniref:Uncharacterized protein n=1 Tax=Cladorrhinum samala TaxID=585594 RepID=A0AAV9HQ70_9PEZI|nr:hypothetical protein QBC42DRAFT_270851 [Cladorrhinum samala]
MRRIIGQIRAFSQSCRPMGPQTPGNPYPIIGAIDPEKPINLPADIPRQNGETTEYNANPGTRVREFARRHQIRFWQDAKPAPAQGKMKEYGFKVRFSRNHIFSANDDEALGHLSHPLTEKTLYRYLHQTSTPLWVHARAWASIDNSIAVVRRYSEKKMKGALWHALARLGFDKHGRALDEQSSQVLYGTIILVSPQPKSFMATDFDVVVNDLVQLIKKHVLPQMVKDAGAPLNRVPTGYHIKQTSTQKRSSVRTYKK